MDRLRVVFQLSACSLLGLAALTFSAAEGNPLAALTLPLLAFSWIMIDRRGAAGIGPVWSFLLGMAAFAAGGWELTFGGIESRILAPAHLLSYLSWIFLLQHKQPRHYWMLFALAVLEMAVASLLSTDPLFGVALGLFLAIGLWSLGLLTLYSSAERVGAGAETEADDTEFDPTGTRDWRGAFNPAVLRVRHSSSVSTILFDPEEPLVGPRLMGGALVLVVASLAAAGLFFLLIPRVWIDQLRIFDNRAYPGSQPLTGFAEEVTLGDMGEILESDDLVMEVELFDHDTGQPIPVDQYIEELGPDPLFRGAVLEQYYNGRWNQLFEDRWVTAPPRTSEPGALQQRIRLQPLGTGTLFGAGNVLTCVPERRADDRIEKRPTATMYRRENERATSSFVYHAISSRSDPDIRGAVFYYRQRCRDVPQTLRRLAEFAQQKVAESGELDALSRARRLEAFLSDPDEFRYSLDLAIQDPNVDPLEDFLFNRREGHCEYFAAALAMMLRGVGIPSRLVSGFKGAELNAKTGRLEVRQLHAHAWVEAYVDRVWVTLDPTPQAREERVAVLTEQSNQSWARWRESWRQTWNRGLQMSQTDQQRLIYEPLEDGLNETWASLRDVRGTATRFGDFVQGLAASPERWFSWRGGVVAFTLLTLLAALTWVVRRIWRMLRKAAGVTNAGTELAAVVPFYERFRTILANHGRMRGVGETQREFALSAGSQLVTPLQEPGLNDLPRQLIDRFYAVRFGNVRLSGTEIQDLNDKLDLLDDRLSTNRSDARATGRSSQEAAN